MFYAGSAVTAGIPGARTYLPAAPMSAVLPGHSYYPSMHSAPIGAPVGYPMSAAPMVYGGGAYGGGAYGRSAYGGGAYGGHAYQGGYSSYYGQPTVILSSAPRSRRSRSSRSRGFLGYL